jgi:hypothetical protein
LNCGRAPPEVLSNARHNRFAQKVFSSFKRSLGMDSTTWEGYNVLVLKNDWLASMADRKPRARVDHLADRCNQGLLRLEDQAEYKNSARFGSFAAILNSNAWQALDNHNRGQCSSAESWVDAAGGSL